MYYLEKESKTNGDLEQYLNITINDSRLKILNSNSRKYINESTVGHLPEAYSSSEISFNIKNN